MPHAIYGKSGTARRDPVDARISILPRLQRWLRFWRYLGLADSA